MSDSILHKDLPGLKAHLLDIEDQIGQEYDYEVLKALLHDYARTWMDIRILEAMKGVGICD